MVQGQAGAVTETNQAGTTPWLLGSVANLAWEVVVAAVVEGKTQQQQSEEEQRMHPWTGRAGRQGLLPPVLQMQVTPGTATVSAPLPVRVAATGLQTR